jgi:hypothetical protein
MACSAAPTAAPAALPRLPAGWVAFSNGPYHGAVRPTWTFFRPRLSGRVGAGDAAEPYTAETVGFCLEACTTRPLRAPLINVQDCLSGFSEPGQPIGDRVAAAQRAAALFQLAPPRASTSTVVGDAQFEGIAHPMLFESDVGGRDVYQVVLTTTTCFQVATLTVEPGDQARVDDFRQFLSELRIDPH